MGSIKRLCVRDVNSKERFERRIIQFAKACWFSTCCSG